MASTFTSCENKKDEDELDPKHITLTEKINDRGYYDVWTGIETNTSEAICIKRVLRRKPIQRHAEERRGQFTREFVAKEISIFRELSHPNIAAYCGYFNTPTHHAIVFQHMQSEDLVDRLLRLQCFTEKMIAEIALQLFNALAYIHELDFIHGDLRINNIFYENATNESNVVITDFGLSRALDENNRYYGIIDCYAPEIVEHRESVKFGNEVDVWSVGVIVYTLLCGYPPFSSHSKDYRQTKKRILYGTYSFHSPVWDVISKGAKHFISGVMKVVPKERMKVDETLAYHTWIRGESAANINLFLDMEKHLKITAAKLKSKH